MAQNITIQGADYGDELIRAEALGKLNQLSTDELEKVAQMTTEKGRKTLKTKWALIKKFI